MIISIHDNWDSARPEHEIFLSGIIRKYKQRFSKKFGPPPITYNFICDVEHLIMSRSQADIIDSIEIFEQYKLKASDYGNRFVSDLKKIFSYENFSVKKIGWDAYKLCGASKAKVCPYCHQVDAKTVTNAKKTKGYRPPLDHFYYQDGYPHLALTLSNFVPACTPCNTHLKADIDFYKYPHLHPLFDGQNVVFSLYCTGIDLDLLQSIEKKPGDVKVGVGAIIKESAATKRTLTTFLMSERYFDSSPEAVEYARSKITYESLKLNKQLDIDFDEVRHTRFDRSSYQNRILGKMFADIHDLLTDG